MKFCEFLEQENIHLSQCKAVVEKRRHHGNIIHKVLSRMVMPILRSEVEENSFNSIYFHLKICQDKEFSMNWLEA